MADAWIRPSAPVLQQAKPLADPAAMLQARCCGVEVIIAGGLCHCDGLRPSLGGCATRLGAVFCGQAAGEENSWVSWSQGGGVFSNRPGSWPLVFPMGSAATCEKEQVEEGLLKCQGACVSGGRAQERLQGRCSFGSFL